MTDTLNIKKPNSRRYFWRPECSKLRNYLLTMRRDSGVEVLAEVRQLHNQKWEALCLPTPKLGVYTELAEARAALLAFIGITDLGCVSDIDIPFSADYEDSFYSETGGAGTRAIPYGLAVVAPA